MKKRIITISREFGSGGRTIGKMLAERLGIPCYDKELIEKLSQATGFDPKYIEEQGEYAPSKNLFSYAFVGRNINGMSVSDYLWNEQRKKILELAEQESCVIVGRCADYILREREDVLNVFVHAPGADRAKRIVEVYNQDGPGFSAEMMNDPGYRNILPKVRSFLPQSSVIGMLLEHEEPYTIIRSNQIGIMQHDPYSWQVLGANFLQVEELTADSRFLDRTFKNWLASMTNEERSEFFDTVFDLLESTGAERAGEIIRPQNVRAYLKTLKSNEYMRNVLATELVRLVSSARQAQTDPFSEIDGQSSESNQNS